MRRVGFLVVGVVMVVTASGMGFELGAADTMEKVFRDEPFKGVGMQKLLIEAARNEVEGVQLVVAAGQKDTGVVNVEVGELVGETGKIPKENVTWRMVGYVQTTKVAYATAKVGWWPDPLLPGKGFVVKAGQVQPVWINVRVPMDAKAGVYRGVVKVKEESGQSKQLPIELRVWDFAVPVRQHLETCFLLRPDELARFYTLKSVPIEMYEKWIDFCLDYRISATLNDWPGWKKDMERLVERQLSRGGSAFCLGVGWFQKGSDESRRKHNEQIVAELKGLYERAKKRGWIDKAYIYCHDEIGKEQYPFARELYSELKRAMPDLRLMQTFYKDDPATALGDVLDVWAPVTGRYKATEFQAEQKKGKQVWWYVCCGPGKPYANLMIEWQGVEHRILLWQTWKYGVSGFLYWGLNCYASNSKGEGRWPAVEWKPATFVNEQGNPHHGDGQLIYPGEGGEPWSSVRLENLRDGIEDYEYLWLLREGVRTLREKGGNEGLVAEAEGVLAIDDGVVKDLTHFTQDTKVLRQARTRIAQLLEQIQNATRR